MPSENYFKLGLLIPCVLWSLSIAAQSGEAAPHDIIKRRTDEIFDRLVKIRRELHAYPELSGQEKASSERVAHYLKSLGLEVRVGIGGYGVIGILKTSKKGKSVAWRADVDALSSMVPDTAEFRSRNTGISHICGHDVNTAIALGIADVLCTLKDRLAGTVYFIFQPSEENYKGAIAMINDGLFDLIKPNEIYALHVAPLPQGLIATKPEWLYADYKAVQVSYKKSGLDQSAITFTKDLISSLQNVLPTSKFWDTNNLLDPAIGLGSPGTIYNDYTTVSPRFTVDETGDQILIRTSICSSSERTMNSTIPFLTKQIGDSKYSMSLNRVEYSSGRAVISNDKELTSNSLRSISSIYGADKVVPLFGVIPDGRGDDFAYFQQQVRGVYFLLGGSNFEKGILSMPHAPNFSVDENCIRTGVKFFSSMILESVGHK